MKKLGDMAVALRLARSSPDRAFRVQALDGDIVLCSWARHNSHSASLHPGVQMGTGEFDAGG